MSKNEPSAPAFTAIPPFTPTQPLTCPCELLVDSLAFSESVKDADVSRSKKMLADSTLSKVVKPRLS